MNELVVSRQVLGRRHAMAMAAVVMIIACRHAHHCHAQLLLL